MTTLPIDHCIADLSATSTAPSRRWQRWREYLIRGSCLISSLALLSQPLLLVALGNSNIMLIVPTQLRLWWRTNLDPHASFYCLMATALASLGLLSRSSRWRVFSVVMVIIGGTLSGLMFLIAMPRG